MAIGKPLYKFRECLVEKLVNQQQLHLHQISNLKASSRNNQQLASTMKSPIYILTAMLPFAVQVAVAVPTAEAADDSLEERGNGNGGGHRWGNNGDHDRDPCVVQKTYWYHKYPCVSSGTVGESKVGDKFQPVCNYQ